MAEWADGSLFRTTVAINFRPEAIGAFMSQLSAEEVVAFQADRAALIGDAPMVSVPPDAAISAFNAYLAQLEASLDQPFLYGDAPSIADFSVYHCLWFVDQNPINAVLLEPFAEVRAWMARVADFGHGDVTDATGEEALAHALATEPVLPEMDSIPIPGIEPGSAVTVTPTDYGRIPVSGTLAGVSSSEIVLERASPETGPVMTHFPNIGFHIAKA